MPTDPVSIAVALADKLDMLVGFWAIDEKPTGIEGPVCAAPGGAGRHPHHPRTSCADCPDARQRRSISSSADVRSVTRQLATANVEPEASCDVLDRDLLAFFADRLKVQLREQGARHDLVDAVFALDGQDDLLLIVRRVEALGKFLDTEDGKNLLAGYQARRQHPAHRGEEGRARLCRRARPVALPPGRGMGAGAARSTPPRRKPPRPSRSEDFAAAMTRDGEAAPARRCLLRQGDGQRRRQGRAAREPARLLNEIREATRAVADFSQDRRLSCYAALRALHR